MLNHTLIDAKLPDFIKVIDSGYTASKHLTILFKKEAPSNTLIPTYNNMLITTI